MQVPVPHDVIEDASLRQNAAWKISVVQTYDPFPAWNQNLLLQEQKLSAVENIAMLQCGEQDYQIHIPFSQFFCFFVKFGLSH
jgi:hypothetical protein